MYERNQSGGEGLRRGGRGTRRRKKKNEVETLKVIKVIPFRIVQGHDTQEALSKDRSEC